MWLQKCATGSNRDVLLLDCIKYNNIKMVASLLEKGASPEKTANTQSPLFTAVEYNRVEIVKLLLDHNADVNVALDYESLPCLLHVALKLDPINEDRIEIIKLLIDHGADVNSMDHQNMTPLIAAIFEGNLEIIEILLNHGADVNTRDNFNRTPLLRAIDLGNLKVIKLLLKYDADVNYESYDNLTHARENPLFCAIDSGDVEIVRTLLYFGAKLNCGHLQSPLHRAVTSKNVEVTKCLLKHGAEIHTKDQWNQTPLHVAAFQDDLQMAQLLLKHGANVNTKWRRFSKTPLHYAIERANVQIVKLFLAHSADINNADDNFLLPMHYVLLLQNIDIGFLPLDITVEKVLRLKETILFHIIKLRSLSAFVSDENLQFLEDERNAYIDILIDNAEKEVRKMKEDEIYANCNVTVYSILMNSVNDVAKILRNSEVKVRLIMRDFENEYPLFYDMLSQKLEQSLIKMRLFKKGHDVLCEILSNVTVLPIVCTLKIFSFFSEAEVKLLINSYEGTKHK